jgi:hypothetical protein
MTALAVLIEQVAAILSQQSDNLSIQNPEGMKNFSLNSCCHRLRIMAGTTMRKRRRHSAHF